MPEHTSDEHFIGPMGSEFWQIRVPPEAVPLMAARFDWNQLGRKVMIDAINGIITWMNPSSPHEGLAIGSDRIVEHVGQLIGLKVSGMRGMRWKRPEDPKNIGLEADASY